jgi:AAA family ATP:ADP antiporter
MNAESDLISSNSSSTNDSQSSKLSNFLDYIWPIHRSELPKFLSITLLMFCILGIQNLIRAQKDSLVNTMIGTETISFLKIGVIPAAFLVTIIYIKLVNCMKGEKIFYLIMSSFLLFFGLFAFYIFPNYETFHLDTDTTNNLVALYPNLKWFILLISNWSISLFYIIAELWPNAVFALLFWQFVNKVTGVEESKRFYPLFGLLGQTGLVISGHFLENQLKINNFVLELLDLHTPSNIMTVQVVLFVVLVLGFIAIITFWFLNHRILDVANVEDLQFKVKKNHMTLLESFKMILSSKYIMLITVLLICYGIAINLVEGPWKYEVSRVYTDVTSYNSFVGGYLKYTGMLTVIFVLVGSNLVRKLGWFSAAIITPIMLFITGITFFSAANFASVAHFIVGVFAVADPVTLALSVGAMQNILSKSSKYTLFDSTKEMSYVPLDDDLKTKGKAAADMIGTKLGKSTSALLQAMIFIIMPAATYRSISVYLMVVFSIICLIWVWAVIALNKEYKSAVLKRETL